MSVVNNACGRVKHLLLVDNDVRLLEATRSFLEVARPQWRSTCASSAAHALELLRAERFDALVTELDMSDASGEQLLVKALDSQPRLKCIVRSCCAELRSARLREGVYAIMPKATNPNALCHVIEAALERDE